MLLHDINRYVNIDTFDFSDPKSILDKGVLGSMSKVKIRVRIGDYFYDYEEAGCFLNMIFEYEDNTIFPPRIYLSDGFQNIDLKELYKGLVICVEEGDIETNNSKDLFIQLPEYNLSKDHLDNGVKR